MLVLIIVAAPGQSQQTPAVAPNGTGAMTPQTATPQDLATPPKSGTIRGTVVDQDGAVITNSKVVLEEEGSPPIESVSDNDGNFNFAGVPPGPFKLSFTSPGFATQTTSGVLQASQDYVTPPVQLVVATTVEVEVHETQQEVAEEQVHVEEKQRLFGVIPNFYVTYVPNAAPLNPKQKFQLAWKSVIDPVSFGLAAATAGIEQADNAYSGYGEGAQGYAKRLGASYADGFSGTFIGGAILPSLLKQDPRYFYKGTGTRKSRFLYAIANAVICKGDNGRWQPNYSNMLGTLAAGGISNLYYPASSRGVGLTFENAAIGIGGSAAVGVFQEFFSRKFTPRASDPSAAQN
ncbi:MAG: carboxypeptidase-like regulatory domain-containing protein [Candidatus Sulfotelmatobacter sp.]